MINQLKALWREAYWTPRDFSLLVKGRFPQWVVYFGGTGFGDDLMLTSVLEELRQRGYRRLAVISRHEALFRHGPKEVKFFNNEWRLIDAARRWGAKTVHPRYLLESQPEYDVPSRSHLITEMCRSIGLSGTVSLRPYFYLTKAEIAALRFSDRQAVIQCPNPATMPHAPLKAWSVEKNRRVVELMAGKLDFIQLGGKDDPLLPGVRDLRGQTSLRESAAILANSRVNVGYTGFLMHLARAVETRSVIIFGGRERPDQSGYAANENLFTPLPCSPCWRRHHCLLDHECAKQISAEAAVAAINRVLDRPGEPLEVGKETIPPGPEPFPLPWLKPPWPAVNPT